MKLTRNQTIAILLVAALFFGFTLLHASWLAPEPEGEPKLIADHAAEPVRDVAGCVASANSGYGAAAVAPDVAALQLAAGSGAQALHITTADVGAHFELRLARQFDSDCPEDKFRLPPTIEEALAGLTKPELFWRVEGPVAAKALLEKLPVTDQRHVVIGDDKAVKFAKSAQPMLLAFSVDGARQCASDYRASLLGAVPESCGNGVMLLTLDDLGFNLWGWPDRFLARMKDANVRLIIAEDVVDGRIKGLTNVHQYGDIADSYNGYIWVDNIEDLGSALRRNRP